MKRYIELFRIPNVWVLLLACFPARVAYGMVGLGIFFKVEQATGSISFAGLAIGLNAAAGSLTAGIRGSIMDKYGQTWPLRIMVPAYAAMAFALNAMHSKPLMLIFAFVAGCKGGFFKGRTDTLETYDFQRGSDGLSIEFLIEDVSVTSYHLSNPTNSIISLPTSIKSTNKFSISSKVKS